MDEYNKNTFSCSKIEGTRNIVTFDCHIRDIRERGRERERERENVVSWAFEPDNKTYALSTVLWYFNYKEIYVKWHSMNNAGEFYENNFMN